MALTDVKVRTAKSQEKAYTLSDEKGLFLHITQNGSKYWRLKYRYLSKEKLLALGVYPDVSLALALERRDEARKLLASNIDPSVQRKVMRIASVNRAANSFELVARECPYPKILSTGNFAILNQASYFFQFNNYITH